MTLKTNRGVYAQVDQIFDDLDKFLEFCKDFGYRFNERDLYNWKSYSWQQYNKFLQNKPAKNMWEIDAKRRQR